MYLFIHTLFAVLSHFFPFCPTTCDCHVKHELNIYYQTRTITFVFAIQCTCSMQLTQHLLFCAFQTSAGPRVVHAACFYFVLQVPTPSIVVPPLSVLFLLQNIMQLYVVKCFHTHFVFLLVLITLVILLTRHFFSPLP